MSNKRKRNDPNVWGYQQDKKPRYNFQEPQDKNKEAQLTSFGFEDYAYHYGGNAQNPSWGYRGDEEDEGPKGGAVVDGDEKVAQPIVPIKQKFEHMIFWQRNIGSVFPLLRETMYRTSVCSNIPNVFLPSPPTNSALKTFCPNPHLFHNRLIACRREKAKGNAKDRQKNERGGKGSNSHPPRYSVTSTEVCQSWRQQLTERLITDKKLPFDDLTLLSRNTALWFGQWCMVCNRELGWKSLEAHIRGKGHFRKYQLQPLSVLYERVNAQFQPIELYQFSEKNAQFTKNFPMFGKFHNSYHATDFMKYMGLDKLDADPENKMRVLVCGDYDLQYGLCLNRLTQGKLDITVAPLQEMNEQHVVVKRNMAEVEKLSNMKLNKDLDIHKRETFLDTNIIKEPFDRVIFLLPQVSFLLNLATPVNSRFLQDVFQTLNSNRVLTYDGALMVLLKKGQFIDWDLCTISHLEGLYLQRKVYHHGGALAPYEPREGITRLKKLNGIKAPSYYIFTRSKTVGFAGINAWVISPDEQQKLNFAVPEKPEKNVKVKQETAQPKMVNEELNEDLVLQEIETRLKSQKQAAAFKREGLL